MRQSQGSVKPSQSKPAHSTDEIVSDNVYFASLKGARPTNEDEHAIILNLNGNNQELQKVDILCVFDGHGSGLVSKFIKENLPKFFVDKRVVYPLSKRYVVDVYDHIQKELGKHNFAKYSGSTCVIAIHFKLGNEHYLNVINTGDSRCVLCRDGFAIALTKDHRPSQFEEYHRITALGGKIKFDGVDWRINDLSVSRAIGDMDSAPYVTHRPDVFRYKLDKSDRFVICFCDGIWESLNNDDVINFVLMNCYDSTMTKRINKNVNVAKKLAEHAIKKGSGDNCSVIIVFFDDDNINSMQSCHLNVSK
jgi:serine/threonine protein phosphatase PrpC